MLEGVVDDRALDLLDGHRVALDVQDAGLLAGGGADAAGELGEVVRLEQHRERVAPAVPVNEVIPFRDEVPERAAGVAEGDAAVHAARALLAELISGEVEVEFLPVPETFSDGAVRRDFARDFLEAGGVTHESGRS